MTQRARITQADIARALKSVKAGGFDKARIILHLNTGEIEILLGDTGREPGTPRLGDGWDDDDI